jgi:polar amino acid transport system substrate-binding protein
MLSGCDIPRDPEGTLQRVRGGTMRVGVTEADPFVVLTGDEPSAGVEIALVERFADDIDADIEWTVGSAEELLAALEVRQLDLVVGGLTSTNPWSAQVTFTHPYLTTFSGIGVPQADQVGDDVAGLEVAVEAGSDVAGLLSETDAEVVLVDDIADADGAAAVESWLFDDLGLHDSDVRLSESDHVMAVPHGENAWLVALEQFLLTRPDEIDALLDKEGHP